MLTRQSPPVQRLGPAADLLALLRRHDVAPEEIIAEVPVSEADFRPSSFLPIGLIARLLDRSAKRLGKPVGLLLGNSQNFAVAGPLGQLICTCETLGAALGTFVNLQIANSTAAAAYLHRQGEEYALSFGLYSPELGSGHIYDLAAAMGENIIRDLTRGAVRPVELLLSRRRPADAAPYSEIAGCPMRLEQSQTCLVVSARSMDGPSVHLA